MIDILYEKMGLPDSCHLGKRIYKKLFHENAKLGATDKKAFREDIETITWEYTLKPSTIPIRSYSDEEREYLEIAIIQVNLKTQHRTGRIAEIIHRAIPYPLVVVFAYESSFLLSLATKRFSQAERGAVVADEFFTTDWIEPALMTTVQVSFLDSLVVSSLPHTDFRAFYYALVDRVIALDCATHTGSFILETAVDRSETRRRALAACRDLESRIAEERAALKKETQFNRKVERNVRIKQMEKELEQKVKEL
jgi:hypothetical protein